MKTIIESRQLGIPSESPKLNWRTRSPESTPTANGASKKGTYLIFVSADGPEIERVAGFEMNGEQQRVKAASPREMLELVLAALNPKGDSKNEMPMLVKFGKLEVDREAHRVWVDGEEIRLTALEFKLLVKLYERRNRVMTREMLLDEVWDIQADIMTRTVDTYVTRLRAKLKGARDYVQSVRAVGYRFVLTPDELGR